MIFGRPRSNTTGWIRHRSSILQLTIAGLILIVYLRVFIYLEDDMSYNTVRAANTAGEADWNATVAKREAKLEESRIRRTKQQESKKSNRGDSDGDETDGEPVSLWRIMLFYMALRFWIRSGASDESGSGNGNNDPSRFARHMTRVQQQAQQERFRLWVARLNHQRQQQGQRPLSLQSLQLVLRERELNDGEDYDALLQFNEESGPAAQALLAEAGATAAEIDRLPLRTVQANDDLLLVRDSNDNNHSSTSHSCAVCLEPYQPGEDVRTIPCFHTFHRVCIDRALSHKAICPVCKHSALA